MIDLHVHTSRCGHAEGSVTEYVEAARAAGIETICFTDHLPLPAGYPTGYTMAPGEMDDYLAEVRAAAAASRDSGGPEVLCGVEADWLPSSMADVRSSLQRLDLDVVLGSIHFIGDWAFDDPDHVARYGEWDLDELWDRYFTEVAAAAGSGLFDVIAHADLVKKFGHMAAADPREWYERAAEAMASGGCAVEVNAAGLRKPVGEIYPAIGLLRACRERGVPATTGSDAHAPSQVGTGLDAARELLLQAGYDSIVVFRGRVAEEAAL